MATTFHLFGGPGDGTALLFEQPPKVYDLPIKPGDRHPAGRAFTRYRLSDEWSKHFKKPVLVPGDFPGSPPKRELQTA